MKFLLAALPMACFLALAGPAVAQEPMSYFRAGEFVQIISNYNYLAACKTAADLNAKLAQGRQLFVNAGATTAVLASYDHLVQVNQTIPFTTTPYSSWTPAQQTAFMNNALDANAVKAWLGPEGQPGPFFYWLGVHVMYLGRTVPTGISKWGYTLASYQPNLTTSFQDFPWLAQNFPTVLATLTPDARNALNSLAQQSRAILAANKGVTADQFASLEAQCEIIHYAAAANRLIASH